MKAGKQREMEEQQRPGEPGLEKGFCSGVGQTGCSQRLLEAQTPTLSGLRPSADPWGGPRSRPAVPVGISPVWRRRSAGRKAAAGAREYNCGTAPRRWRPAPCPGAVGFESLESPPPLWRPGRGDGRRRIWEERNEALRRHGILEPRWSKPAPPPSQRWRNRSSMLGGLGDLLSKLGSPRTGCVTRGKFINLSEHGFPQLSNDGRDEYGEPRGCCKH